MTPADEVALLESLVACRSPSGDEGAAAALFTERLAAAGMRTRVDTAGNAIAEVGDGDLTICLLGHIDTVPGWPPVRIEDDVLWGRGSVDAKGPLCTFACAAARLDAETLARARVVVVGAVEEEAASSKGARHIVGELRPDACVIGEPSGVRGITLGYKGRLLLAVECAVAWSHSAGRDATAPEVGADVWRAVQQEADRLGGDREFARVTPSLLSFTSDNDGLVDRARLSIGLRVPPGFDRDAFVAAVRAACPHANVTPSAGEVAYRSKRTNPVARAFHRAIRTSGSEPRYVLKTGTSDMNVVGPVWNCPIVAYGPGDSSLDHTPDEHLPLAEYRIAIDVVADAIRRLASPGALHAAR